MPGHQAKDTRDAHQLFTCQDSLGLRVKLAAVLDIAAVLVLAFAHKSSSDTDNVSAGGINLARLVTELSYDEDLAAGDRAHTKRPRDGPLSQSRYLFVKRRILKSDIQVTFCIFSSRIIFTGFNVTRGPRMFDRRKGRGSEPVAPVPPQKPADAPERNPTTISRMAAMIGASIKIKGDITGDEDLVIEGHVEGKVDLSNHELTIGAAGKVDANLSANTVHIHGAVNGDIDGTELVVVSKTGRVLGNIVAPRVTLEDGAQFKGSIDMSPENARVLPARDSNPKPQSANGDDNEKGAPDQAVA